MSKKSIPNVVARTGADHHNLILLAAIYGSIKPDGMSKYLAVARSILKSPDAFDDGAGGDQIHDILMHDGLRDWSPRLGQMLRDIAGNELVPFTANRQDLQSLLCAVITEARLYGAALMCELLNGGAR